MRQRVLPAIVLATAAAGLLAGLLVPRPSEAMPPFAQASGVNCNACHVMVPMLNAYGRFIQHTQYAGLSHDAMKQVSPIWFAESVRGRSSRKLDSTQPAKTMTYGSISVDASGFAGPEITYRIEQSIYRNDQSGGGLGRIWLAYSGFLHNEGHLAVGKLGPPVPSIFTGSADMTGFATPGMAVGKHSMRLSSTRWGSTFNYVHQWVDAEVGWLSGSSNALSGKDFSINPGTDRAFQWKLAYSPADRPLEFGFYGANGSYVLSGVGRLDRYSTLGEYVERDPGPHGIPGIMAFYDRNHDSNPGTTNNGSLPTGTASRAYAVELNEPLFNNAVLVGIRREMTDNGLGTIIHYGVADLAFRVPHVPYLFARIEAALGGYTSAPYGRPTWGWTMQWEGPISGPITRIR